MATILMRLVKHEGCFDQTLFRRVAELKTEFTANFLHRAILAQDHSRNAPQALFSRYVDQGLEQNRAQTMRLPSISH